MPPHPENAAADMYAIPVHRNTFPDISGTVFNRINAKNKHKKLVYVPIRGKQLTCLLTPWVLVHVSTKNVTPCNGLNVYEVPYVRGGVSRVYEKQPLTLVC